MLRCQPHIANAAQNLIWGLIGSAQNATAPETITAQRLEAPDQVRGRAETMTRFQLTKSRSNAIYPQDVVGILQNQTKNHKSFPAGKDVQPPQTARSDRENPLQLPLFRIFFSSAST